MMGIGDILRDMMHETHVLPPKNGLFVLINTFAMALLVFAFRGF